MYISAFSLNPNNFVYFLQHWTRVRYDEARTKDWASHNKQQNIRSKNRNNTIVNRWLNLTESMRWRQRNEFISWFFPTQKRILIDPFRRLPNRHGADGTSNRKRLRFCGPWTHRRRGTWWWSAIPHRCNCGRWCADLPNHCVKPKVNRNQQKWMVKNVNYQAKMWALGWTAMAVIPCEVPGVWIVFHDEGFRISMKRISPAKLQICPTMTNNRLVQHGQVFTCRWPGSFPWTNWCRSTGLQWPNVNVPSKSWCARFEHCTAGRKVLQSHPRKRPKIRNDLCNEQGQIFSWNAFCWLTEVYLEDCDEQRWRNSRIRSEYLPLCTRAPRPTVGPIGRLQLPAIAAILGPNRGPDRSSVSTATFPRCSSTPMPSCSLPRIRSFDSLLRRLEVSSGRPDASWAEWNPSRCGTSRHRSRWAATHRRGRWWTRETWCGRLWAVGYWNGRSARSSPSPKHWNVRSDGKPSQVSHWRCHLTRLTRHLLTCIHLYRQRPAKDRTDGIESPRGPTDFGCKRAARRIDWKWPCVKFHQQNMWKSFHERSPSNCLP